MMFTWTILARKNISGSILAGNISSYRVSILEASEKLDFIFEFLFSWVTFYYVIEVLCYILLCYKNFK